MTSTPDTLAPAQPGVRLRRLGFGPDAVAYQDAWDEQRRTHAAVVDGSEPGTVLLLEHPPTYTAGKRTAPGRPSQRRHARWSTSTAAGRSPGTAPASWSATRSCALAEPIDVVEHVRRIELLLIDVCRELGLETVQVDGPQRGVGAGRPPARGHPAGAQGGRHRRARVAAASRCTASRSTATATCRGSTASCPAASPTQGVTSLTRRARAHGHRRRGAPAGRAPPARPLLAGDRGRVVSGTVPEPGSAAPSTALGRASHPGRGQALREVRRRDRRHPDPQEPPLRRRPCPAPQAAGGPARRADDPRRSARARGARAVRPARRPRRAHPAVQRRRRAREGLDPGHPRLRDQGAGGPRPRSARLRRPAPRTSCSSTSRCSASAAPTSSSASSTPRPMGRRQLFGYMIGRYGVSGGIAKLKATAAGLARPFTGFATEDVLLRRTDRVRPVRRARAPRAGRPGTADAEREEGLGGRRRGAGQGRAARLRPAAAVLHRRGHHADRGRRRSTGRRRTSPSGASRCRSPTSPRLPASPPRRPPSRPRSTRGRRSSSTAPSARSCGPGRRRTAPRSSAAASRETRHLQRRRRVEHVTEVSDGVRADDAIVATAPDGRRMLRIEARNAEVPIERKPTWIKTTLRTGPEFRRITGLVKSEGLHTVCQEAGCPNIYECWEDAEATFLIGGSQCSRRCDFCQIDTGRPDPLDRDEPRRVGGVGRHDGPALRHRHRRRPRRPRRRGRLAVRRDRAQDPRAQPRHRRRGAHPGLLRQPRAARPGLRRRPRGARAQPRDRAPHLQAHPPGVPLRALPRRASPRPAPPGMVTKSNLILGMGETIDEVVQALHDLHEAGCDLITITQYLRPSPQAPPGRRAG